MPEAPQITKLELLIKEKSDEFSANEKIIADYFIRNESRILSVSVPQISKECSVSKATVVRFCKRLGFSGLKDFKIFYQTGKMDVGKFTGPVCWTDSDQVAFYKVFTSAISALQQTFRRISWEDLSQAAGLIAKATNIDAFAIGGSAIIANYFSNEFIRLGKRVNAHTDIYTIRHFSQEFKKDDLVIFFSRSGENLTQLASRAKASQRASPLSTGSSASSASSARSAPRFRKRARKCPSPRTWCGYRCAMPPWQGIPGSASS